MIKRACAIRERGLSRCERGWEEDEGNRVNMLGGAVKMTGLRG